MKTTCSLCKSDAFQKYMIDDCSIMECTNCELRFRYPQPDMMHLKNIYAQSYNRANINNGKTMASPVSVLEQLLGYFEENFKLRDKSLLDYGCGVGDFGDMAARKGMKVTGVEFSEDACKFMNETRLFDIYPDLHELEETNIKFDFITLIEVIEHLREPWGTLNRLKMLLKESGVMYISTPNYENLRPVIRKGEWKEYKKSDHFYWFNEKSLFFLCRKAGFHNIKRLNWRIIETECSPVRRFAQHILQPIRLGGGLKLLLTS